MRPAALPFNIMSAGNGGIIMWRRRRGNEIERSSPLERALPASRALARHVWRARAEAGRRCWLAVLLSCR